MTINADCLHIIHVAVITSTILMITQTCKAQSLLIFWYADIQCFDIAGTNHNMPLLTTVITIVDRLLWHMHTVHQAIINNAKQTQASAPKEKQRQTNKEKNKGNPWGVKDRFSIARLVFQTWLCVGRAGFRPRFSLTSSPASPKDLMHSYFLFPCFLSHNPLGAQVRLLP